MKHLEIYEKFQIVHHEKEAPAAALTLDLRSTLLPELEKVMELVKHYADKVGDLIKIQSEVNKIQRAVTDAIREGSPVTTEVDWDSIPKAPIFVLNLKNKYPHLEAKYYELWVKAAHRQPVFNYGGAIQIFKTYCKREELMLEDHDYGYGDEYIVDEGISDKKR